MLLETLRHTLRFVGHWFPAPHEEMELMEAAAHGASKACSYLSHAALLTKAQGSGRQSRERKDLKKEFPGLLNISNISLDDQ
jgi:hypothetical protein